MSGSFGSKRGTEDHLQGGKRNEKPTIDIAEKGPFLIKGPVRYTDKDGNEIETDREVVALCRCGASENKLFCDGAHSDIGFTGDKERTETYPTREYAGDELTVVDNIGICCHWGACVNGAPDVFFKWDGDEGIFCSGRGRSGEGDQGRPSLPFRIARLQAGREAAGRVFQRARSVRVLRWAPSRPGRYRTQRRRSAGHE